MKSGFYPRHLRLKDNLTDHERSEVRNHDRDKISPPRFFPKCQPKQRTLS
jgi:hypothetical protein